MTKHIFPYPPNDPLSRPHWEAALRNVLLLQQCLSCKSHRFPATRTCPVCHSAEGSWIESSGHGTIESFCVFHKAYWPGVDGALPYNVIQVRLDEGVQMMSSAVDIESNEIRIGMRVRAYFDQVAPDLTLVKFTRPPTS